MSFLSPRDSGFVEGVFRRYYELRSETVYVPERLGEREFGYFPFGGKIMIRHLSVDSPEELRRLLRENAPLHIYHSAAFYRYPRAPMEEKGWMGAELIFDIDADHLKTPCGKGHDFKVCPRCLRPHPFEADVCGECGGGLVKVEWVCELCLEAARDEARKLLDFLEGDLGFSKIRLAFSGNRGYHVVVRDENALELGQLERKEIVDYVTGTGLSLRAMGLVEDPRRDGIAPWGGPDIDDPGWRGRIARAAVQLALRADPEELAELSGRPRLAERAAEELRKSAEEWGERPAWDAVSRSAVKVLGEAAVAHAAAHVDVVVTSDIHRLLRLGDSLNGKTGMSAKTFDAGRLEDFDPFLEAAVLPTDEEVEVKVIRAPRFRLGDGEFGPYENQVVKLPTAAAVLLLAKGTATLHETARARSP